MSKTATAVAKTDDAVTALVQLQDRYGPAALAPLKGVQRSLALADGIELVRQAMTALAPRLRSLAGRQLGFKCDKEYPENVIVECATEAILRGVNLTGNEFNILAGRCYVTKEGYQRLVRELDGLTDLILLPGVPKMADGGAVVPMTATWKLNGVPAKREQAIPVRLNNGMGVDGAIGKATRKMLAQVHAQVTGSEQSANDVMDDPLEPGEQPLATSGKADALKERLQAATGKPADGKLFPNDSQGLPD